MNIKTKSINLIQVLQNWINETYSAYIDASGNNKGYWLRIGENYGNDNRVPFVLSVNNVANAVIAYIAGIVNEDGTVKSINIEPIVGSNIYNNLLKDIALIENYLFIGKGADNSNSVTSKAEIKVYDLESDSFLTSDNGYDVLYNKVNIDHFFIEYLDSGSPYWNFVISAPVLINAYSSIDNNGILLTEIALESCSIDWGGGSVENFNKNSFISNLSYLGYDETNRFEAYVLGKKDGHYYAIQNVNNNLRIIKSNSLILKTDTDGNALNTPPINVKSFTSSDGQLQIPVKGFITLKNDNFVLYNNTDKKYQLFDFEGNFIKDLVESQSNNLMFAYTNKTAYYTTMNTLNNEYTELYSDVPDNSWLKIEPQNGDGNTTMKISSLRKNAREGKSYTITVSNLEETKVGNIIVVQEAYPLFVDIDNDNFINWIIQQVIKLLGVKLIYVKILMLLHLL